MYLNDFDLRQLAARNLEALPVAEKDRLLGKLLSDLIEARERLQAHSRNSSRPPSSDPPWSGPGRQAGRDEDAAEVQAEAKASKAERMEPGGSKPAAAERRKPGRQLGAPGHSRTVIGPVAATLVHVPESCAVCGAALRSEAFVARTGLYVLDLKTEREEGLRGLALIQHKHVYGECRCEGCGHVTRTEPARSPADPRWKVDLSEWCCVGPRLLSLIVCPSLRMRLSRRAVQEFLHDWFDLGLSTSTIHRCLHEAGRAVEPLEQTLLEEVQQAALAYADETPWKEWGQLLWLWGEAPRRRLEITTPTLSLYLIGYRTAELIENALGIDFSGWLMSDGYRVYRRFYQRLRCWAHLLRKAQGLKDSLTREASAFGAAALALLDDAMAAVYAAREGPPGVSLTDRFRARLDAFRTLCECHQSSRHEKTRALAVEFLNDWEAVWIVLSHPHLPLTNNEAERALRHWVILRRICHGTRAPEGSRALALLASVIETCRKRHHLPWPYLAQVIAARRKGHPAPPLPAVA